MQIFLASRHPLVVIELASISLIGAANVIGFEPPVSIGEVVSSGWLARMWGFGLMISGLIALWSILGRWKDIAQRLRTERAAMIQLAISSTFWLASIIAYTGWSAPTGLLLVGSLVVASAIRAIQVTATLGRLKGVRTNGDGTK